MCGYIYIYIYLDKLHFYFLYFPVDSPYIFNEFLTASWKSVLGKLNERAHKLKEMY